MNILEELNSLAEENYKEFNSKIIPTKQKTLGVRIPALRKLAKNIAKAWLISNCMAKFPKKTTIFLKNNTFR